MICECLTPLAFWRGGGGEALDALTEAVFPVGYFEVKCLFYFCLVEHAVMGTCGRRGIFGGVERPNMAGGDTCKAVYGLGEVVPRRDALVREMIDTGHYALIDGRHDGYGEVAGIGRRAYLVEDDAQFALLTSEAKHSLYEVVAKTAIEPSSADDHCRGVSGADGLLTLELRATIDRGGAGGLVFGVGLVRRAVEDVVGGDLYELSAAALDGLGEVAGGGGVEEAGFVGIALGAVYGGVGSAVDDDVDGIGFDKGEDGRAVGDIEGGDGGQTVVN